MNKERRYVKAEVRMVDGDRPRITGLIPYESRSLDLGGFREIITPSAFTRSLESGEDIVALYQHDPDRRMGRTSKGTLSLRSTPEGLSIDLVPNDTTWSRDAIEIIRHGDADGFSFGFTTRKDDWRVENEETIRDLIDVDLHEVSVVFDPAYAANAEIGVRVAPEAVKRAIEIRSAIKPTRRSLKLLEMRLRLAEKLRP